MKNRCTNTRTRDYRFYGLRGITICDRWLYSFQNFLADMGRKPSPQHTIERIDVNGPYTGPCAQYPNGNCRWATRAEQHRNTRLNHRVTYHGVTLNLGEWAKRLGINPGTLSSRLGKLGWPIERALSELP